MAELATLTIRVTTNKVLCIVGWIVCAGVVIAQFGVGHPLTGVKASAIVLVVAYLLWLLFWSPSVTLSPTTLGVRNLFRHYDIAWTAVQELPLGMTLRAVTGNRRITLLAVPGRGNSGRSYGRGAAIGRAAGGSLDAAVTVRRYFKAFHDTKPGAQILHDDEPVIVRWMAPEILILCVLIVAAVLVLVLVP
jgi:hypothetical protein